MTLKASVCFNWSACRMVEQHLKIPPLTPFWHHNVSDISCYFPKRTLHWDWPDVRRLGKKPGFFIFHTITSVIFHVYVCAQYQECLKGQTVWKCTPLSPVELTPLCDSRLFTLPSSVALFRTVISTFALRCGRITHTDQLFFLPWWQFNEFHFLIGL